MQISQLVDVIAKIWLQIWAQHTKIFCCQQHFTLESYFAMSYLWLVNLNDVLNMWLLVVSDWLILLIS